MRKLQEAWSFEERESFALRFFQQRYFTNALGGMVSAAIPLEDGWVILDANCGPGIWSLDLLKLYPTAQVVGIDRSKAIIEEARRLARVSGSARADFRVVDLQQNPDYFRNRTFDLVHMRNASIMIRPEQWPETITALVKVLRPGGWINLVDYEPGPTSSEAFNQLQRHGIEILRREQKTFNPASSRIGIASHLYSFLLQAPLIDVTYTIHAVDLGFGNSQHARPFVEGMLAICAGNKLQLQQMGIVSSRDYDALLAQAESELLHPYACGYGTLFAASGCKDG